ncbi:MAG: hypothetical protein QRY71_03965 [Candidatus Rhabdochlamydia sp.]
MSNLISIHSLPPTRQDDSNLTQQDRDLALSNDLHLEELPNMQPLTPSSHQRSWPDCHTALTVLSIGVSILGLKMGNPVFVKRSIALTRAIIILIAAHIIYKPGLIVTNLIAFEILIKTERKGIWIGLIIDLLYEIRRGISRYINPDQSFPPENTTSLFDPIEEDPYNPEDALKILGIKEEDKNNALLIRTKSEKMVGWLEIRIQGIGMKNPIAQDLAYTQKVIQEACVTLEKEIQKNQTYLKKITG